MPNIVVTGFMGTGKTVVAREVARRVGCPFLDMDTEIERRAKKSIPRIFAEDGESAFRQMEALLVDELMTGSPTPRGGSGPNVGHTSAGRVIATGGGTLVDAANRAKMMRGGIVVCLSCDVDEILCRLDTSGVAAGIHERPLLHVPDPRAEIEHLLEARREAYRAIPWQIDTTELSIDEIADRVVVVAEVITLRVHHPSGKYPIHIGPGVLSHVGGTLRAAAPTAGECVAVVANPVVARLYYRQVEESLLSLGFRPLACTIPDGEQHKTLDTVSALYAQFLAGGLDRSGTVLSLGGGVTGDVAGFAAASFMRGVRFGQIPTTLLAMMDASVGGKTGVDLPQGKNLVGAFKQPSLVIIDPSVLETLPPEEIRSGLAEVIKHGVIDAPSLFAELEEAHGDISSLWDRGAAERIARSLRVKIRVVEEDPFERGRRAVLNLGHTTGHALERLSGFEMRHGDAVSIGMVVAARIAAELGQAEPSLAGCIEAALSSWELPVRCPSLEADAILEAMMHDKKRRGRTLRWVLPRAIGEVDIIESVSPSIVKSVLCEIGARCET